MFASRIRELNAAQRADDFDWPAILYRSRKGISRAAWRRPRTRNRGNSLVAPGMATRAMLSGAKLCSRGGASASAVSGVQRARPLAPP
jgi:hypothetical protein